MWATKEQLILSDNDQEWIDQFKELMGVEYKPSEIEIDKETGIAFHFGTDSYLKWSYDNVEDCICDHLMGNEEGIMIIDGLADIQTARQSGKEFIQTYGLTDMSYDDQEIVDNLLTNYPELKHLANGDESYIINLEIAEGGVRFHKNGGYRGGDDVGESVYDSPADEYLMFSVFKVSK